MTAITYPEWCERYQIPNTTVSPYMDKHNIKLILPEIAPGLKFAKEFGYFADADAITEKFISELPSSYYMKVNHLGGGVGVMKVKGTSII